MVADPVRFVVCACLMSSTLDLLAWQFQGARSSTHMRMFALLPVRAVTLHFRKVSMP